MFRMPMKSLLIGMMATVVLTGFTPAGQVFAGEDADEKGIERAVLDYVSSIYDMKPELLDRSVSPRLQKLGYMPARDGSGLEESWMIINVIWEMGSH